MASPKPSQIRAVDPYASYDSNTVNELTRIVTYGDDGLATSESCDITMDSTSQTTVSMSTGLVFKDDVWLNVTQTHTVDFQDSDHYYNFDTGFDEAGYYYIVFAYTYAKQRPAPQAEILILKPTQRAAYVSGNEWLFLKAVHVSWTGSQFIVDGVYDFDPEDENNRREYIRVYAGAENSLPIFTSPRDVSRILYNRDDGDFYFGLANQWSEPLNGSKDAYVLEMDTSGFEIGDMVYVTAANTVAKAIATTENTSADGCVTKVGINGRVRITGQIERVPVQDSQSVSIGDLTYLSQVQPGKVTSTKTIPISQFVGRCNGIYDSTSVNILFVRGEPRFDTAADLAAYVTDRLQPPNWISSVGLYYQDVDISTISGASGAMMIYDTTSLLKIEPETIEFVDNDTLRIWMTVDSEDISIIFIGPAISSGSANNHIVIHESLSVGSWIASGSDYYQDVDISSITTEACIIMVRDSDSDEAAYPSDIQFLDTTSVVRIWMPVSTQNLEVTAIGPTATLSTAYAAYAILPAGASWISSMGSYYQDISLSVFGGDNEVVISCVDNFTGKVIVPQNIEFVSSTVVRIWMSLNTVQLNVTLIG